MTFNSQLKQLAQQVAPIVNLPNVDQSIGEWRSNGVCCVGARLAHALNAGTLYYLNGAEAFAQAIGGNRAHLVLMLRDSGAGWDPFDADPWHYPVATVWRALQTRETLPDLRQADLSCVSLDYADLSHADFAGTDFTAAILTQAILTAANFTHANLTGVLMDQVSATTANFSHAVLNFAQLERGDFTDANFHDADLSNASLDHADFSGANFADANLIGATVVSAKFNGANLSGAAFDPNELRF